MVHLGAKVSDVSIHAPARGATSIMRLVPSVLRFQFTLPRGERPPEGKMLVNRKLFQFTLPRGERLWSIANRQRCKCFNSRSREGSDGLVGSAYGRTLGFNSRSREGSDKEPLDVVPIVLSVSIHAPARGATSPLLPMQRGKYSFNSRSREGSDSRCLLAVCSRSCFNSRSREGSDVALLQTDGKGNVSIHAPARGATLQASRAYPQFYVSIHAPARGATDRGILIQDILEF